MGGAILQRMTGEELLLAAVRCDRRIRACIDAELNRRAWQGPPPLRARAADASRVARPCRLIAPAARAA